MQKLNQIKEKIESAKIITIFRHVHPDMDAYGSQMGLKLALLSLYPEKEVYALGNMDFHGCTMDVVDDEVVKQSLAIILDTSNAARVDDSRYTLAQDSIRIDHHVQVETLANLEWIDDKASATCEMLPLYFQTMKQTIPSSAAQWLYNGLVADNIRFTIDSVRKESFLAAAYLMDQKVNVIQTEIDNFASTLNDFKYENKVRNRAQLKNQSLTSIMHKNDYEELGMKFTDAKDKVYALSGIKEIEVWALFTENPDGSFNASLRARTKCIREIAAQYNGGGHACASGIKGLNLGQVHEIIDLLAKRSIED